MMGLLRRSLALFTILGATLCPAQTHISEIRPNGLVDPQAEESQETLRVLLTDNKGTSLTGATVQAYRHSVSASALRAGEQMHYQSISSAQADANGVAVLPLPPYPHGTLVFQHESCIPALHRIEEIKKSASPYNDGTTATVLQVTMSLSQRRVLSGFVADASGNPLPNVKVTAYPETQEGPYYGHAETLDSAQTDGDGEFHLNHAPDKPLLLQFAAPGYATAWQVGRPGEEFAINLGRGSTVTGIARHIDGSTPVGGVQLSLSLQYSGDQEDKRTRRRWNATTQVGASGAFTFHNVPAGQYNLYALGNQNQEPQMAVWNSAGRDSQPVQVAEDQPTVGVNTTLHSGRILRGQVREQGTTVPVSGVSVWLTHTHPHRMSVTDANGFYEFDRLLNHTGRYRVSATHDHYKLTRDMHDFGNTTPTLTVEASSESPITTFDISMAREQIIAGQVIDKATKAPVAGAQVLAVTDSHFLGEAGGNSEKFRKATSNHEGKFEILVTPGSPARLRVSAAGYGLTVSEPLTVANVDSENIIELTRGGTVRGRVTLPDGQPANEATVAYNISRASIGSNLPRTSYFERLGKTSTDAEGNFVVTDLPADSPVTFHAYKQEFANALPMQVTPSNDRDTSTALQLREPFYLAGKVLDASGNPLANVMIHFQMNGSSDSSMIKSNNDGSWRTSALPEGTATAYMSYPNYGTEYFYNLKTGTEDVILQFSKGDKNGQNREQLDESHPSRRTAKNSIPLYGTLVDWRTQEPVKDFKVTASYGLKVVQNDEDMKTGNFKVEGLRVNYPYQTIRITAPGYADYDSEQLHVSVGMTEMRKTFKLGPGGSITGRAIDKETQQPIAGITAALTAEVPGASSLPKDEKPSEAVTDAEGRFTLTGIGHGVKSLKFTPPADSPYVAMTQTTTAAYNEVTDLGDVEFGTGGTIKGKLVRTPGNEPIPSASIITNRDHKTTTDADGEFEFTNLVNGLYQVQAPEHFASAWVGVEQLDTKEITLEVGSGKLHGNVTQSGQGVRASVSAQIIGQGQSVSRHATSDSNGVFSVPGLAPARWQVTITADSGASVQRHVTMPATGEDVNETFELPSGQLRVNVIDAAGKAVPSARVQVRMTAGRDASIQPTALQTMTDTNGAASFANLAPGTYTAAAFGDDGERAEQPDITIGGDQENAVTLTLSSGNGGTLISTALNLTTGKPVPSAWCYLWNKDGRLFEHGQTRDEMGTMQITGIPAGTYHVQVSALGFSASEQQITITDGQVQNIDDVLYPSGALRWALRRSDGTPVPNVPCRLTPMDPDSMEEERTGTSTADGMFVVRGIMPGTYTATADVPGGSAVTAVIRIYAANVSDEVAWIK